MKLGINDILQCHQRRTEPWPQATCTKKMVKYEQLVFEIMLLTSRRTGHRTVGVPLIDYSNSSDCIRNLLTLWSIASISTHTHTHTHTHNRFTAVCILSGTTRVSRYQKKHSPTHTYRGHQSYLICFVHLIQFMASSCSIHAPDSLFPQSLSKSSLVYFLAWHPPLHTPYISSPKHCLLFATHAHTIATCFAVLQ